MPYDLLDDFTEYCRRHPAERSWQALRNRSGAEEIVAVDGGGNRHDTFYWTARDGYGRTGADR